MTTGKLLATAGILLALVSLSFLPAAAQHVSLMHRKITRSASARLL
jgi:hypothetical protein